MALRNAFEGLALNSTLVAVRDRLAGVLDIAGTDHDGIVRRIRTDAIGRIKTIHGQPPPSTLDLIAIGGALVLSMDGFSTATFYFSGTAHAGYNIQFEQSPDSTDGVNGKWFPTIGASIGSNVAAVATGVLPTNGLSAWDVTAPGASFVRARVTARTSGTVNALATASTSSIEAAPVIPTHAVTQSGTWAVNAVTTPTTTSAALSALRLVSAASTNATLVKNTVGRVVNVHASNAHATEWRYLKFYNKATAPIPGTDTPVFTIGVAPGRDRDVVIAPGFNFALGIGLATTTGSADLDATALTTAGDFVLALGYV